jgi:hypothetical protein
MLLLFRHMLIDNLEEEKKLKIQNPTAKQRETKNDFYLVRLQVFCDASLQTGSFTHA